MIISVSESTKQDAVELFFGHCIEGNVVNVAVEGKGVAAAAVAFAAAFIHGQVKLGIRLRKVQQVIAVNVPSENT